MYTVYLQQTCFQFYFWVKTFYVQCYNESHPTFINNKFVYTPQNTNNKCKVNKIKKIAGKKKMIKLQTVKRFYIYKCEIYLKEEILNYFFKSRRIKKVQVIILQFVWVQNTLMCVYTIEIRSCVLPRLHHKNEGSKLINIVI